MTVRTRFAPSPTGYLHIGGVRTALFNWLFTRRQGGQFLLRIDDTDAQRNVEEALAPILHGFRWLGLHWDEGPEIGGPHAPYYQSQRLKRYQEEVERLLKSGAAYYDYATADEIAAERLEAEREKRPFVYSRRYMAESADEQSRFEKEGRKRVVRLKMPREGTCVIQDHIRGRVEVQWAREQDHVVQRADGTCLYHLASVVDDFDFEITHVIRAEEHLPNTPRQVFIVQSLGYGLPQYAHVPYVAAPASKEKLSKRKLDKYLKMPDFRKLNEHGAAIAQAIGIGTSADTFNPVIVDFYEQVGYLPDAIVNYLVLLGWSLDDKTEFFSRQQMVDSFSLERVNSSPAAFDPKKLWAFQDHYMKGLPPKQKVAMMLPFLQRAKLVSSPPPCEVGPLLMRIVEAAGDRLKTAGDIIQYADFFFLDLPRYESDAVEKRLKAPGVAERLTRFRALLATVAPWTAAALEEAMNRFIAAEGIAIGDIIHAVRVAVTGKTVGPGMFDCLELLGKERVEGRLEEGVKMAGTA
ncbi:MAG: glutamate--tRNA ligase [Planctomycetia bacterium]|nr:glutamate--tRNA ligase [Planctomycetia bacterium]